MIHLNLRLILKKKKVQTSNSIPFLLTTASISEIFGGA